MRIHVCADCGWEYPDSIEICLSCGSPHYVVSYGGYRNKNEKEVQARGDN